MASHINQNIPVGGKRRLCVGSDEDDEVASSNKVARFVYNRNLCPTPEAVATRETDTSKVQKATSDLLTESFNLNSKHFAISEAINSVLHYLPDNSEITYDHLQTIYEKYKVGHCLQVSTTHNYYSNFSIYIKCKKCISKINECYSSKNKDCCDDAHNTEKAVEQSQNMFAHYQPPAQSKEPSSSTMTRNDESTDCRKQHILGSWWPGKAPMTQSIDHECISTSVLACEMIQCKDKIKAFIPATHLSDYMILQVNGCGWYQIYFNFALSQITQSTILSHIKAYFEDKGIVSTCEVGANTEANLPFFSTNDATTFETVQCADLRKFPIVPKEYFDVALLFVEQLNFEWHEPIGEVVFTKNSNGLDDEDEQQHYNENEWMEGSATTYLVKKLNAKFVRKKNIQDLIIHLKHGAYAFTSIFYPNLEKFINNKRSITLDYSFDEENFNELVMPEFQAIHCELSELVKKCTKIDPSTSHYTNFLRYIATASGWYAFYFFVAIAKLIMIKLSNKNQDMDYTIFTKTLKHLRVLLMSVKDFRECEYLVKILDMTLNMDCVFRLCVAINCSYWLSTLRDSVLIEHWGLESFIKNSMFSFFRLSSASHSDFLQRFSIVFLRKISHVWRSKNYVYVYSTQHRKYQEVRNTQHYIFKSWFQKAYNSIKIVLRSLSEYSSPSSGSKSSNNSTSSRKDVKHLEYKKVYVDAVESLLGEAKELPQAFNNYSYFINTEIGIFNTITGTYMSHLPCLFFNTEKEFATSLRSIETTSINLDCSMNLLSNYHDLRLVLESVLDHQRDLYYLSIVVPGLLVWEDMDSKCHLVFNSVYSNMQVDAATLGTKMFFMLPVLQKFKFNFDSVMQYATIIDKHLDKIESYDDALNVIANVLEVRTSDNHVVTKIKDFDYTKVYDVDSEELVQEFLNTYKVFNPIAFAVSYILCIFQEKSASKQLVIESDENCTLLSNAEKLHETDSFNVEYDHWYYATSDYNYLRALNIIFRRKNITTTVATCKLLYVLSHQFQFDATVLDEFLESFSMLYCPVCPRKRLQVIIGPPKCGKTGFIKQIESAHLKTKYNSISSFVLENNSGGPSPDQIAMYNSYLVSLTEVDNTNADAIKAITGNEELSKRSMFRDCYHTLFPLPYLIGSTNKLPTMKKPDESIRCRMAFFTFDYAFWNKESLVMFDNPLEMFEKKILYMSSTPPDYALTLFNTLYVQFMRKRTSQGDILSNLSNSASTRTMDAFLRKNNPVYEILHDLKIQVGEGLSIQYSKIDELLADLPDDKFSKISRDTFNFNFKEIFQGFRNANDSNLYEGIGFPKPKSCVDVDFSDEALFSPAEGCTVKSSDLLRTIINQTKSSRGDVLKLLTKFISCTKIKYDEQKRQFLDVKMKR